MQEHFLKEIEIIDYKCFKNFTAKGFKRVNLISGKNNIGKTAFMEANYINISSKNVEAFISAITAVSYRRNNLEYIASRHSREDDKNDLEKHSNIALLSNIHYSKFNLTTENGVRKYLFDLDKKNIEVNSNEFSFNNIFINNFNYIDNFGLANSELKDYFGSIQINDKENNLNNYINEFDSSISSFKIIGDSPKCKKTHDKDYLPINEYGDGLKHYISIICTLYASKNGYLFIDELDNGIHFSHIERLWEIIFSISKEVNCQVFATTHSKEMINAFAKVSKKLEDEDMSFIELGRNKDNETKALVMNFEKFQYEMKNENEVRGW